MNKPRKQPKIPTFVVDENGKLIDILFTERTAKREALFTAALEQPELPQQEH